MAARLINWQSLLDLHQVSNSRPINAERIVRIYPEDEARSRPLEIVGSDGNRYIVKGLQSDRGPTQARRLMIEQVVGNLGTAIGAPVPQARIMNIPTTLVSAYDGLVILPGPSHASEYIPDCETLSKGQVPEPGDSESLRRRLALVSILFGWISVTTHVHEPQFLKSKRPPFLFHSIDHGLLSSSVPLWENDAEVDFAEYWSQTGSFLAKPVKRIYKSLLRNEWQDPREIPELAFACERLRKVTPETIAEILAKIPTEWGFSTQDLIRFAMYVERRRNELVLWPIGAK